MRRRFALSIAYLVALTAALAFADLGVAMTAGLMAAGWVLLALVEWTTWHDVEHFGAGYPPVWRARHVRLPPPRPLEQFAQGYPDALRDEGATWIASRAVREELFRAWPIAPSDDEAWAADAPPEDTQPAVVRTSRHHVDPTSPETILVPVRPTHRALPLRLKDRGRRT